VRKGVIDFDLSDEIDRVGGFSTTLNFADRQKLRAITKRVHMMYFPADMQSDYEADRIIDQMGPETVAYLIRHNLEGKSDG